MSIFMNSPPHYSPVSGSVRSLRGSLGTVASSFGPAAKPTITLIVFSTVSNYNYNYNYSNYNYIWFRSC